MRNHEYDASEMIQDYAPVHADTKEPDCYIRTIDRPVAVHLFNRRVVIVGNDGVVESFMWR